MEGLESALAKSTASAKPAIKAKNTSRKTKKTSAKPFRPYPKVLLSRAIELAQTIKINGGHPWPPSDVANAMGVGGKTTDFYYLTAAARDFGLTTGSRDTETIALTDLGRELVYAPNPTTEEAKKSEAFLKIALFDKVLKHYQGGTLPDMKYLGNTLEREFKLDPIFHEEFAQVFRENCSYLKIASAPEMAANGNVPTTIIVAESSQKKAPKVFVIMPFIERTAERSKGFFSEVLKSLITPAAVNAGFSVETANQQGSDVIQSTIVNELLEADLVIADLTDHNPNVLFELGLRMATEKPVALIKASGTGRVFDVDNMLRVVEYQPQLWISTVGTDLAVLEKHFKAAWDNRSKIQSYMKILRRPPSALQEVTVLS